MEHPIPESWCCEVVAILQTYDDRSIDWTPMALQRWKTDTFGAWRQEAYEAIIAALSRPISGNETTSMPGQTATYEFLFHYKNKNMYGKIALKKGGLKILILSAHKAERSSL